MRGRLFTISREDGRSNQQVIIDLVCKDEPGKVYAYDAFAAELSRGTATEYDIRRVQGIVLSCTRRLLLEYQRALMNLKGVGYKLALAGDHQGMALIHRRRSDSQLAKGLGLLRHVRLNEMDENTRQAHLGTMMVMEAIYQNQRALERRMSRVEDAIASMKDKDVRG